MQERRSLHEGIPEHWLIQIGRQKWVPFFLAVVAVGFATLIRFPLDPIFGDAGPFLFYFPVVFVISAAFGLKPGCLATVLSLFLANYCWMEPKWTLSINTPQSLEMIGFSCAGYCLAWLGEALRKQKQLKESLRAMVASVGDALVSVDPEGRIVFLNPTAQMLTGLQSEDVIGKAIGNAFSLRRETNHQPLSTEFENALRRDEIEKLPERLIIVSKSGIQHRVEQKTSRILDSKGRKMGVVILFHDGRHARQVDGHPDPEEART